MENRINYNEPCTECLNVGGIKQNLFLDMDKMEIRCELGHVFEELPSDAALRTGGEKTESGEVSDEKIAPEIAPEAVGTVQNVVENDATNDAEPQAIPEELLNTLEQAELSKVATSQAEAENEKLAELAARVPANRVTGTDEPVIPVSLGGRGTFVSEANSITLPNGDLLMAIRIPEVWRQAVEAEAQAQLKSPAAYFADWLTSQEMRSTIIDWLENYWTAAYAQTV